MASSSTVKEAKEAITRGKLWSEDTTRVLIQVWGEEKIQEALNKCKCSRQTREVYCSIMSEMRANGYEFLTVQEIINKMKKLRQKYKTEKDKTKKSGNGRQKKWKFFDSMDNIMGKNHNVCPPHIHDLMAENDKLSSVEEMAEKYGKGETYVQKCPTCTYEQQIQTEGVHVLESGIVKMYSEEDTFHCPKCNVDETAEYDNTTIDSAEQSDLEVKEKEKPAKRKKKKTALEKSLGYAFQKMEENADKEFERYKEFEEKRMEREQGFALKQAALDNQRRAQEREHELSVLRLLTGNVTVPTYDISQNQSGNTYFQL